jgi:hypothetical protein
MMASRVASCAHAGRLHAAQISSRITTAPNAAFAI